MSASKTGEDGVENQKTDLPTDDLYSLLRALLSHAAKEYGESGNLVLHLDKGPKTPGKLLWNVLPDMSGWVLTFVEESDGKDKDDVQEAV